MLRLIDPVPAMWNERTDNLLIAALSGDDTAALLQFATRMTLNSGAPALLGDAADVLWFPETAVLSFGEALGDRPVECGIVGREGAIGWQARPSPANGAQRVTALIGGTVLALRCDTLSALYLRRPAIAAAMTGFRDVLMTQMRWTIATRLQCGPEQRLARWLSMLHDRVEGDTLDITHLRLAAFLNARRASVTDCLHVLEGERMVRCTRGKIFIRDRAALDAIAGAGYGPPESAYRTLLGPFGKSARPA